jgi:hypothetical protein
MRLLIIVLFAKTSDNSGNVATFADGGMLRHNLETFTPSRNLSDFQDNRMQIALYRNTEECDGKNASYRHHRRKLHDAKKEPAAAKLRVSF